jgi:multicomponent Na+:H+ antiporter subunit E
MAERDNERKQTMTRRPLQVVALGIAVYAVWLLLSGHYTPRLLITGLLCTLLAVYVAVRMDVVDEEGVPLIHLTRHVWSYLPWLFVEIVRSNIAVVRIILHPKMPISPTIVRFKGRQRSDLGRVIFANSITLTPGTVTIAVVGQELYVHALYGAAVDGIEEGEMNRRVASLVRDNPGS